MAVELPRLWDFLTGGAGLGAIFSAVASWAAQKQRLEDVVAQVDTNTDDIKKIDERSRLVERIDERTQAMLRDQAAMNVKIDAVLRELRGQVDNHR